MTLHRARAVSLALFVLSVCAAPAQIVRETVFFDVPNSIAVSPQPTPTQLEGAVGLAAGYPVDVNRMTLIALLYHPDPAVHGPGPYPAVIVLHGSGGMWSNDTIASGPSTPFQKWGLLLAARGFLCVIPDSYNPRGIPAGFSSRRPHHDPAVDDSLCSPNYERPKDVVAALTYLKARSDFDGENVGLLGFSHGAQTGLNAMLDVSVDRFPVGQPYNEDYVSQADGTVKHTVPAPVRIPDELPMPRMCVFYYPGCGHFAYHGQSSSIAAGRYMPDRRTQVIMFHGTEDSLLGVANVNASPLTGSLFPIKFTLSSGLQAAAVGVPNPFIYHHIYDLVEHSFDQTTIEPQNNWNTAAENADERANRLSQAETLKWFEFRLRRHTLTAEANQPNPGVHRIQWTGRDQLRYRIQSGINLIDWPDLSTDIIGSGAPLSAPIIIPVENRTFHRLVVDPVPPPVNDPLYVDFFLEYGSFSY